MASNAPMTTRKSIDDMAKIKLDLAKIALETFKKRLVSRVPGSLPRLSCSILLLVYYTFAENCTMMK